MVDIFISVQIVSNFLQLQFNLDTNRIPVLESVSTSVVLWVHTSTIYFVLDFILNLKIFFLLLFTFLLNQMFYSSYTIFFFLILY